MSNQKLDHILCQLFYMNVIDIFFYTQTPCLHLDVSVFVSSAFQVQKKEVATNLPRERNGTVGNGTTELFMSLQCHVASVTDSSDARSATYGSTGRRLCCTYVVSCHVLRLIMLKGDIQIKFDLIDLPTFTLMHPHVLTNTHRHMHTCTYTLK